MKKLIMVIIAISFFDVAFSQDGVLGIKFGSSKECVKQALENRFGEYNVHDKSGNLSVYNGVFAGIEFNCLDFEFAWRNGTPYFNSATLQTWFQPNDIENAKKCRDIIFEKIKMKYDYYEEDNNSDGFKTYKFGLNPNDSTKATGMISIERSEGKDGKERLYLLVYYFPYFPNADISDL